MEYDELMSRIDICRAASDDLADENLRALADRVARDAELKRLLDRIQALDAQITFALEDVPLPEGLEDRILARLAEAQSAAETGEMALPLNKADETVATPAQPAGRYRVFTTRRVWMAAAAAALVAVATTVMLSWPSSTDLTSDAIASAARELFTAELDAAPGELVSVAPPPAGFPITTYMAKMPDARWHRLSQFLGRSGIAYQLHRAQARAVLYVVKLAGGPGRAKIDAINILTAPRPASTSGVTTAVWREQGLLYIFVVEGAEAEYRQFFAPSPVVT